MSTEAIRDRLARLIDATGPIPVSTYLEHALYGPDGFYMTGGHAGRRGDFLTAPEVGPLFGAVVARAVDSWWAAAGRPESFTVLEWGAGPGTLARSVLAATPDVLVSGALRWVAVERSPAQRALHPTHPHFDSVAPEDAPTVEAGVVLANELLDNLPFDIVERGPDGWTEVRVGIEDGRLVENRVAAVAAPPVASLPADAPVGTRLPVQAAARAWLVDAIARIGRGRVVVLDYGGSSADLVERRGGWLRTHASHGAGGHWLAEPGTCDITTDVDFDQLQQLRTADLQESQGDWLRRHGIDELVEEGRAVWAASAAVGDLAALKARSRIRESEALIDADGMGAFRVLEWTVPAKK